MNEKYIKFTKFLTLLAMFGLTLNYFAVRAGSFEVEADQVYTPAQIDGQQNGYSCVSGANIWKVENGNTADLPLGYSISSIIVKAGNENSTPEPCKEVYPTNNYGSCYTVAISGNDVVVTKIGSGPNCKDISHLEGTYVQASPTPSPSPSEDPSPTPEVSPSPDVSPSPTPTDEPNCEELENCEDPSPTPEVSPSPDVSPSPTPTNTPNSCDPEQSCPTHCGAGATDVANGSCGVKHCDPVPACDNNDVPSDDTPGVGGASQGQVLGATTDTYAATGVAEDIAFSLVGLAGTGLSSLGILMRRNEEK